MKKYPKYLTRINRQLSKYTQENLSGPAGLCLSKDGTIVRFHPCENIKDALMLLEGTIDAEGWSDCLAKDSTHDFSIQVRGGIVAWIYVK